MHQIVNTAVRIRKWGGLVALAFAFLGLIIFVFEDKRTEEQLAASIKALASRLFPDEKAWINVAVRREYRPSGGTHQSPWTAAVTTEKDVRVVSLMSVRNENQWESARHALQELETRVGKKVAVIIHQEKYAGEYEWKKYGKKKGGLEEKMRLEDGWEIAKVE